MADTAPKASNDEYAMCFRGIRLQTEAHGLDPNDDKQHKLILHRAEIAAQDTATIRWLYNLINPPKDHDYYNMVPQTVENLQKIMACDAVKMWELDKQLTQANHTIQKLQKRLSRRKQ